jgi:hypothetical protein
MTVRVIACNEELTMKVFCPKCSEQLTYVTSVPHPKFPAMQRTTFLWTTPCNRTWSYTLSPSMAETYGLTIEGTLSSMHSAIEPGLPELKAADPPTR